MARVIQHAQHELEIITGDLTHMARHSMPYIAENHGVGSDSIKRAAWLAATVMEGVYMQSTPPDYLVGVAGCAICQLSSGLPTLCNANGTIRHHPQVRRQELAWVSSAPSGAAPAAVAAQGVVAGAGGPEESPCRQAVRQQA